MLVETGEHQQIIDEHLHPRGLLLDPPHHHGEVEIGVIGAETEQFGKALNRRQRCAQFVRRVGEKLPELALGGVALV